MPTVTPMQILWGEHLPGSNVNIEGYPNTPTTNWTRLLSKPTLWSSRYSHGQSRFEYFRFSEAREYVELANTEIDQNQYKFHPQLGYITLNQALNQDEVLAVAFQYTAGGRTYKVGEFSNDGVTPPKTLILKLLKSTVLDVRMPIWDLMMKNIYALNAFSWIVKTSTWTCCT